MAIFEDDDIETMLADWENTLTFGEAEAPCLFEERDELLLEGEQGAAPQIAAHIVATIRVSDFPALAQNSEIEVDGREFTVWRYLLLGDGALAELWLRAEA
jgi:hypothetical protein